MTEQLKEIGTRLEELRDICGVSAEEMANKLEMTLEEYCAYEEGQIVKANIVLRPGFEPSEELTKELKEYVKNNTAP